MNFNNNIDVYSNISTSDGYGGVTNEYIKHSTIKAALAPITIENIISGGREINHQVIKLFTKNKIDLQDFAINYKDVTYKYMTFTDYGKVMLYIMEIDK
jgi:head-tail adaptor